MKNILIWLLLWITATNTGICQQVKKAYYNNYWDFVENKEYASFYCIWTKDDKGLVAMEGFTKSDKKVFSGYGNLKKFNLFEDREGHFVFFDTLGNLTHEGDYHWGQRTGKWTYYQEEVGKLSMKINYESDSIVDMISYDANGQIQFRINTKYGVAEQYRAGELWVRCSLRDSSRITYANGAQTVEKLDLSAPNETKKGKNFSSGLAKQGFPRKEWSYLELHDTASARQTIERFPVGMQNWLPRYVHMPEQAKAAFVSGRVNIFFTVEPSGRISHVILASGTYPFFDEEALRVFSELPSWQPASEQMNYPVLFIQPLTFRVE